MRTTSWSNKNKLENNENYGNQGFNREDRNIITPKENLI